MDKKFKFLFVLPFYACMTNNGAGQRTDLLYRVLQSLGSVDVLIIGLGKAEFFSKFFPNANSLHVVQPYERAELGLWRLIRPIHPKLLDFVATAFGSRNALYQPDQHVAPVLEKLQATDHDLVIGRYLRPTARSGVLLSGKTPVILDVDDRDDVVYESRLGQPGVDPISRLILKWHLQQMRQIMSQLLPLCKHLWLVSEADAQAVRHPSISILPNIPYVFDLERNYQPTPVNPTSKTILFVGAYGHRVNREGVERFISTCWQQISSAVDNATFRVVGSGGWENLREKYRHIPNIQIAGFSKDLAAEYQQAAFTVVPLFEGGGTKIKVLETFFHGRTAVATPHALYGYEMLRDRESLLVASNEQELIDRCIELLQDVDLRSRLADAGRTKVVANYSFNRFSSAVRETIESYANSSSVPLDKAAI